MTKITLPLDVDVDKVPLNFGKHEGKTPNQLLEECEYGYMIWLGDNRPDVISKELVELAEEYYGLEKPPLF